MDYLSVIDVIENIAPLAAASSWDKSGIQVVSMVQEVTCIAVCLDPTPQAIQKAIENGAEGIVSHHPLTLKPQFLDSNSIYYNAAKLLIANNIFLYAAHTSLDANIAGPASWLAEELGLCNCVALDPIIIDDLNGQYGFGRIGSFPSAISINRFQELLRPIVKGSVPRLVGKLPNTIQKVAFCPGAGADYAEHAAEQKADVLITGDVKYHQALEFKLPVLDVGHFCLEEEMMHRMAILLQEMLPKVKVLFMPAYDPLQAFYIV